jgi:hypothetical protein
MGWWNPVAFVPAAQQLDFFAVDVSAKKCGRASGSKGSQVYRGKFGARGC